MDLAPTPAVQHALDRADRSFRRNITGALAIGLVALVVLVLGALWLYGRERSYGAWVDHTYAAEAKISSLATSLERVETARRGYLLSPRDVYWETYVATKGVLAPRLDDMEAFTADNPVQRANIGQLRTLLEAKSAQLRDSIERAHSGDLAGGRQAFLDGQDGRVTERLRATLAAMGAEERRLLSERAGEQQRNEAGLLAVTLATAVLLGALGLGSVVLVRRYSAELQRSQGALRRLNEGLEQAVRDRTVELTRANEEIQRFAYIVSHDLRSPLVNVMGFTSELEASAPALHRLIARADAEHPGLVDKDSRTLVDEELPEAIGFIRKSTQKMDRLINAILKLSREGRRNLAAERLDMDALAEGVIATVHQLAEGRGAEVTMEPGLPDLVGDRVAVEQLFSNLIENAVKYLKPGRPGRVVVRGRVAGGRLLYEVEDNGRGVDPKDHERIFELFRRSGAQDQPGEGIGLAHVRAMVYRMGGAISCISELDRGATFRVSLPRQPVREEEAA